MLRIFVEEIYSLKGESREDTVIYRAWKGDYLPKEAKSVRLMYLDSCGMKIGDSLLDRSSPFRVIQVQYTDNTEEIQDIANMIFNTGRGREIVAQCNHTFIFSVNNLMIHVNFYTDKFKTFEFSPYTL